MKCILKPKAPPAICLIMLRSLSVIIFTILGADIEAAETWGVEPTMPVGSLGDMGIAAAGYGPVGGTAGGWSNLDADPTETW